MPCVDSTLCAHWLSPASQSELSAHLQLAVVLGGGGHESSQQRERRADELRELRLAEIPVVYHRLNTPHELVVMSVCKHHGTLQGASRLDLVDCTLSTSHPLSLSLEAIKIELVMMMLKHTGHHETLLVLPPRRRDSRYDGC